MKNKRGISLTVLVITIVVVIILAVAAILVLMDGGILDNSRKAKFMNNFIGVDV